MNGRARAIGSGLLVTATRLALVGVATAAADDAPSHPEAAHAAASRAGGSAGLRSVDPAVRAKNDQVVVQKFADAVAAGRQDLGGVNPANASPADQDAMAQHLLATQGLGPWGGSCG